MSENEEPKVEQASEGGVAVELTQKILRTVNAAHQPADPMTQEQFSAHMTELTERARAAGLRPVQAMLATYVKLGMTMLDKVLEGLEPVDSPKKKE